MKSVNLTELAQVAAGESTGLRAIIEKEIIHYDVLSVMSDKGYLANLTFQGGTALRLCYGSERLSEDLDFTGGTGFKQETMTHLKGDIETYLHDKYGLAVTVRPPKEVPSNEGILVSAWQVTVETRPEDRSVPRQRVKIEVANVPSYTRETRLIQNNYPALPNAEVLVQVQTQEEIMADKLLAFPISSAIRYRDIWDLAFLARHNIKPDLRLLKQKINDYSVSKYPVALSSRVNALRDIIESNEFRDQMSRFLPSDSINNKVARPEFREALFHQVNDLFSVVRQGLEADRTPSLS